MSQGPAFNNIIVVGAGPSGLLLALLLAKNGIAVTLIDQQSGLDTNPRATHYGAPAMYELNRAGVGDEIRARGFLPAGVSWRNIEGEVLAGLDATVLGDDPDRMTCLPLDQLGQILQDHVMKQESAKVLFHHKVTSTGQDDQQAWVVVQTPDGEQTLTADYIVGCDGANSQIRRSFFGDWEFPGKTWDQQIIATNINYDFDKFGWNDSNFIVHPEHWFMAARITKDGLWRVTYGEKPGLTSEELIARQPEKFRQMLPGRPGPGEYDIRNFSPYKVHQRLAKSMRVGRFLLAADAAHLCNPFGGLGLTGGIVDVGNLFDCLKGIYDNKIDSSILEKYSDIRRKKYLEIVDPISSANLMRLFELDPARAVEQDPFFRMMHKASADDDFSRQLQNSVKDLQHDFTQYYAAATEAKAK